MSNHPAGYVCVVIPPNGAGTIITADGVQHNSEIDAQGRAVVWLAPDDARRLMNSGLPESLPWREANAQLSANLGAMPRQQPQPTLAQMQNAHWQATRPLSIVEEARQLRSAVLGGWRS